VISSVRRASRPLTTRIIGTRRLVRRVWSRTDPMRLRICLTKKKTSMAINRMFHSKKKSLMRKT